MTDQKYATKIVLISTALVVLSGTVNSQSISPAQRQEFTDAKTELNNVLKGPYQKYAALESPTKLQAAHSETRYLSMSSLSGIFTPSRA